jgi:hypothetical protein
MLVVIAVGYLAGIKFGFWDRDVEVIAALGAAAVWFLRSGIHALNEDRQARVRANGDGDALDRVNADLQRELELERAGEYKTAPPSTMPLIALFFCLALSGCARFSTVQTDTSYDEHDKPTRSVTTRAKASTFFTSRSALANFKASQTDKTQGASVGSLTQESSGTNAVRVIEGLARIAEALPK